jgi:hypothetical protein
LAVKGLLTHKENKMAKKSLVGILQKAAIDPAYRKLLKKDPRQALVEAGIKPKPQTKYVVVEETKRKSFLVLPPVPKKKSEEAAFGILPPPKGTTPPPPKPGAPIDKVLAYVQSRATQEPAYRKQVKQDPAKMLIEAGLRESEAKRFQVLEDTPDTIHLVLPPKQASASDAGPSFGIIPPPKARTRQKRKPAPQDKDSVHGIAFGGRFSRHLTGHFLSA